MFVISLSRLCGVHVCTCTYLVPPLVFPMWPPRSPCGENRVLRYSTVRYGTCCMRHYIMSAAFGYLPTGTYRSCLLPPSHRKPAYFLSFPQRHPPLSLSLVHDTLSTLQHTSGRYLGNTRHTYINNQNPPSLSPSSAKRYKQPSSNKQPCALMCSTRYLGTGNS